MKTHILKKVEHETRIGDKCPYIEPNVTEDCLFVEDGEVVGFYIRNIGQHSEKLQKLITVANNELLSDRVPKSLMERSDVWDTQKKLGITRKQAIALSVAQYSTILGSIPPRPHMKRPYPSRSSVHAVESAQTFIKAMLLACKESEQLIKKLAPSIYTAQKKAVEKNVPKEWRFGELFTSSISNFNIAAPFHIDRQNIKECVNVIITKRKKQGWLHNSP